MINLIKLSEAMFAATLMLCALPMTIGGQENPNSSPVVIEDHVQSLRTKFDSFKNDFERRLDRIESSIGEPKRHPVPPSNGSHNVPERDAKTRDSVARSDDSGSQVCCWHIYHHEPCCRRISHPQPYCRHVYYPIP
jgi:hypothetical protein